MFVRRKVHNASRMFRRAVLGGQIAFLVGLLVVILFGVRMMFPPLSPERAAAVSWLEENTERYRIIKFHPTTVDETGKSRLWVEYHYTTPQGRGIDTRRIFTVVENRVIAVDSEE